MILISLLVGIFFRVYKIGSNYFFSGEQGRELLYVRELISSIHFPLVGLTTSHEWLTYGPVYYWILIPLVEIFGSSPFILFWLALVVSTVGIYLTYLIFSKIVSKKFAIILSFFISLSPLWIQISRLSKLHTFFFILIPFIIFFLYQIWNKRFKYMFLLGVVFGLLFSFHFSHIPILIVILGVFWLRRKKIVTGDYIKFIIGVILPNITILIFDGSQKFIMVKNLILWIPYRLAGFIGVYPKNNINISTARNTLSSFNEFFGRNLFWDARFWIFGSVIFVVMFTIFIVENRKKFTKNFLVFYLISSTIVQCLALLIHTTPPIHYFLPIFLNFGLLFSYYINKNWQKISTKIFLISIFTLMFVANLQGLSNEHINDMDYVPLQSQKYVVDYIVSDAKGKPFNLDRIGPFDYFPENYSQAYQYLILSKGGRIDRSAKLKYTIYDADGVFVFKHE